MKVANRVNNIIFRPVEVYTSAALIYLAVGLALMALAAWVERRYGSEAVRLRQGRGAPTGGIARAA
jgi:ABC-type amino acid transport system permease subunit